MFFIFFRFLFFYFVRVLPPIDLSMFNLYVCVVVDDVVVVDVVVDDVVVEKKKRAVVATRRRSL